MKRGTFIKNTSMTALGISAFGIMDSKSKPLMSTNNLKINEQRILNRILQLTKFGTDEIGHG